jgi:cycloeucalenol cycloisomerase
MVWLSTHPGKRATERFWLWYTPVWGAVIGVAMITGAAERWGDIELMLTGVLLGLGAFVGPLVFRAPEERGLPVQKSAAFKLGLSVVGFAFFLNYSQTPFFWDVLHMHYGFNSSINIQNNPVFLYFLTIAYFATYSVLVMCAYRFVRQRMAFAPRLLRCLAVALVPFVVAALETLMNANPWTTSLFCYDDMQFMMWFGTLAYGISFVCALPVWISIDEEPAASVPLLRVAIWVCAATYLDGLALDVLRHWVAPHFTTVVEGANGLRDFGTSCLTPLGAR